MVSTLNRLFAKELASKGKEIYDYNKDKNVRVLVRMNADRNTADNKLTIMYPLDAEIDQGDELIYNGLHYLALNKDYGESQAYYSSDLIELSMVGVFSGSDYIYLRHIYMNDSASASISDKTYIYVTDASVSGYASAFDLRIGIGGEFKASYGTAYTLAHVIKKDGIAYFYGTYLGAGNSNAPGMPKVFGLTYTEVTTDIIMNEPVEIDFYTYGKTSESSTTQYRMMGRDFIPTVIGVEGESVVNEDGTITFLQAGEMHVRAYVVNEFCDLIEQEFTFTVLASEKVYTATITADNDRAEFYTGNDYTTLTVTVYADGEVLEDTSGIRYDWSSNSTSAITSLLNAPSESSYSGYARGNPVKISSIPTDMKGTDLTITVTIQDVNNDYATLTEASITRPVITYGE